MKRVLSILLAGLVVIGLSGCFPVFIPVGGHHHDRDDYRYDYRGDRGHHRGW